MVVQAQKMLAPNSKGAWAPSCSKRTAVAASCLRCMKSGATAAAPQPLFRLHSPACRPSRGTHLQVVDHENASDDDMDVSRPQTPQDAASRNDENRDVDMPDDGCGPSRQPGESEEASSSQEAPQGLGVRVALGMLAFYRNGISPLMQPSCRYIPSCSVYAIESYKRFGGSKGTVLTAWRLLRCSPFGSSGYDPPVWPPPGLGLMFQYDGSADVAALLGSATVVFVLQQLWLELTS